MAACGYTDTDLPDAPPIAGGGGQAWHMGSHYGNIAISAALMYRSVTGMGQYIDVSIHESCALTREMHVNTWIYQKKIPMRQTGRHASAAPNQQSQHVCADGKYLNVAAQILTALTPERLHILGEWMKEEGLSEDLIEEKYRNPDSITDNELFLYFIANMSRDDVFHGGQKRGFNMGAIRNLDEVMQDPHLDDRNYWAEVDYPELGLKLKHPGPGGIFKGSPWKISRRAPFLGEHNEEILSGELGMSDDEIGNLGKSGAI